MSACPTNSSLLTNARPTKLKLVSQNLICPTTPSYDILISPTMENFKLVVSHNDGAIFQCVISLESINVSKGDKFLDIEKQFTYLLNDRVTSYLIVRLILIYRNTRCDKERRTMARRGRINVVMSKKARGHRK